MIPIRTGKLPMIVAEYHTDEFSPNLTSPAIVAFGATKSAWLISGTFPLYSSFLKEGTNLSSLANSPTILVPV